MLTCKEGNAIIANYLGYKYYSKGEDPYEYGWRLDKSKNYRRDYFLSRKPNLLIHLDNELLLKVLFNLLIDKNIEFVHVNKEIKFCINSELYTINLNNIKSIYFNTILLIQNYGQKII